MIHIENVPWVCAICGISEWMGIKVPLQLDHQDGNRLNCTRSNLRFLCPNCHALTPTFTGRNSPSSTHKINDIEFRNAYDKIINNTSQVPTAGAVYREMGYTCRPRNAQQRDRLIEALGKDRPITYRVKQVANKTKIQWPTDRALEDLLKANSRVKVSKILGVSDTAIRKRCSLRGIPEPSSRVGRRTHKPIIVHSVRLTKEDRRKRVEKRLEKLHGTRSGYLIEGRLGIPRCSRCRKANTDYTKYVINKTSK
jgi:predicted RNA-binding Zn-ribbon protein involved in translation (DUF1610 family)